MTALRCCSVELMDAMLVLGTICERDVVRVDGCGRLELSTFVRATSALMISVP